MQNHTALLDRNLLLPVIVMMVLVAASNYLVQFPVNDWMTWGALTYPITFLVTDLTNRRFGPARARRVVYMGFVLAVLVSAALATPRIALASGSAFLVAQLLDVRVFNRLRQGAWWRAPLVSSVFGSALDTALFFSLAFVATGLPWVTWALGDFAQKMAMELLMQAPFRLLIALIWAR